VSVEIPDLCEELQYDFIVSARYPTVGLRTFTELFKIEKQGQAIVAGADKDKASSGAFAALAVPTQISYPSTLHRGETTQIAVFTWPGLSEAEKLDQLTLEVQGCDASASESLEELRWVSCSDLLLREEDGVKYIAAHNLPFRVARFRLLHAALGQAGLSSARMVLGYEVPPAPRAELEILGTPPKALGAMLKMSLTCPLGTHHLATMIQVRLRALGKGAHDHSSKWVELPPAPKPTAGITGSECATLVREEDGLDLGTAYEFCVRVGDEYQLGPWSGSSKPYRFQLPPPVPPHKDGDECPGLSVRTGPTSTTFKWPAYVPQTFTCSSPGMQQRLHSLTVEYMIVVSMAGHSEPMSTLVTQDTTITVQALTPGKAYTAILLGRWARFGTCWGDVVASPTEAAKLGLMAAFVTESATAGDISSPVPGESLHRYVIPEGEDTFGINLNFDGFDIKSSYRKQIGSSLPPLLDSLSPGSSRMDYNHDSLSAASPSLIEGSTASPLGANHSTSPLSLKEVSLEGVNYSTSPSSLIGSPSGLSPTGEDYARQSTTPPNFLPSLVPPPKFSPRSQADSLKAMKFVPPRPTGSRPVRCRITQQPYDVVSPYDAV
jgi:hypothetical protein